MTKKKQARDDIISTTEDQEPAAGDSRVEIEVGQEESAAGAESPTPATSEDEEQQLANRVEDLEGRLLRAMADFDNYKKRTARQFEDIVRTANDSLIAELLEIVDNFERALEHNAASGADDDTADAVGQGTQLIYNQMIELLQRYDVQPIESLGKPFDPKHHEALMTVASEEYAEGMVAVEITKGYMQGTRVLRHAQVGVSSGESEQENE
jgi:molecular chaperone GrpE